jgi:hypothetical protein
VKTSSLAAVISVQMDTGGIRRMAHAMNVQTIAQNVMMKTSALNVMTDSTGA